MLKVYVPGPGTFAHQVIARGSGIVGSPADEGTIRIDYEGGLTGAVNIRSTGDKVYHAAGRHESHYPTSARLWVSPDDLIEVGEWDGERLRVTDEAALAEWLGGPVTKADLARTDLR